MTLMVLLMSGRNLLQVQRYYILYLKARVFMYIGQKIRIGLKSLDFMMRREDLYIKVDLSSNLPPFSLLSFATSRLKAKFQPLPINH